MDWIKGKEILNEVPVIETIIGENPVPWVSDKHKLEIVVPYLGINQLPDKLRSGMSQVEWQTVPGPKYLLLSINYLKNPSTVVVFPE